MEGDEGPKNTEFLWEKYENREGGSINYDTYGSVYNYDTKVYLYGMHYNNIILFYT